VTWHGWAWHGSLSMIVRGAMIEGVVGSSAARKDLVRQAVVRHAWVGRDENG